MYLNPRLLKDTLTIKKRSPAAFDPNTGATVAGGDETTILTQPCSDQDVRFKQRSLGIETVNGIPGSPPVSIAYTYEYKLPELTEGESYVYYVNGRLRPLLRAGPPLDIGGQHAVWQLELGPPEAGG